MTYKVISGFQDLDTGVFYDIHTEIDEKNENLEKYLKAGVVVKDDEEIIDEEIIDEEIIDEDTVEEEVATNDEKKTENTKDAKKKG